MKYVKRTITDRNGDDIEIAGWETDEDADERDIAELMAQGMTRPAAERIVELKRRREGT